MWLELLNKVGSDGIRMDTVEYQIGYSIVAIKDTK